MYLVWNIRFIVLYTRSERGKLYDDGGYQEILSQPSKWPRISVILPARSEDERVLRRNLESIQRLNYDMSLIELLIVVDVDDQRTARLAEKLQAAYSFKARVIIVPEEESPLWRQVYDEWAKSNAKWLDETKAGLPKMKPRALAYALPHVSGEIVTVVDAEDVQGDKDVLLRAAYCLKWKGFDAVQGRLKFVNYKDSWFSLHAVGDYALWFDWMLPRLKHRGLPLPLAGTSYFIKADVLRSVGGWNPINMTEDLELGVRLYCHGYKVGMIDSDTFEEAPRRFLKADGEGGWLNQRTRWCRGVSYTLKGIVRDRHEFPTRRVLTVFFVMFYYVLGWSVQITNFIGYPLSALFLIFLPIFDLPGWLVSLFILNGALLAWCIFSTGKGIAYNIGKAIQSLREKGKYYGLFCSTVIFYWFVWVTPAARALKQELMDPIFWEKTDHLGLHHPVCNALLASGEKAQTS